jgi:hypothetical protein
MTCVRARPYYLSLRTPRATYPTIRCRYGHPPRGANGKNHFTLNRWLLSLRVNIIISASITNSTPDIQNASTKAPDSGTPSGTEGRNEEVDQEEFDHYWETEVGLEVRLSDFNLLIRLEVDAP